MTLATVLLVEDDGPTRERLSRAVRECAGLSLVAACGDVSSGRQVLDSERPDVLLTDLELPDGSGIDLIRAARETSLHTQCMAVTVFGDERTVLAAIEAGASGYLLKDGTSEDIGRAVQQLLEGGSPISPTIARHLLRRFREPEEADRPQAAPAAAIPDASDDVELTAREREVLDLIAKGFSFPEIAELLAISAHTVTTHVRHIYGKLEVRSKSEAVYEAVNRGLIDLGR